MVGPLSYLGGKNRVARKIISLIPEHTCYIEPFCGGAQVFFHKEPSKVELLNDLNDDIFNFLRICQIHHEELQQPALIAEIERARVALLETLQLAELA